MMSAGTVETIVVDNASRDGSAELIEKRYPWVRLIVNHENVGFARANNQGIRAATAPYVMLLNSDTVVHPGALRTLVSFLDRSRKTGAVGPCLLNADGTLQPSCHPMLTPGLRILAPALS